MTFNPGELTRFVFWQEELLAAPIWPHCQVGEPAGSCLTLLRVQEQESQPVPMCQAELYETAICGSKMAKDQQFYTVQHESNDSERKTKEKSECHVNI